MLSAELTVRSEREDGLTGSGLIIVNPPYTLKGELDILLPFLKEKLAQDRFASSRIAWIRGE
jgi:23S rRNA (adenine2030-N6)-methyltransferase